jgi:hypothetical protein
MKILKAIAIAIAGAFALICPHLAAAETGLSPNSADLSYFPIGVWLQSPFHAPEYKAIGINLFVGLYDGPTETQLAELARNIICRYSLSRTMLR